MGQLNHLFLHTLLHTVNPENIPWVPVQRQHAQVNNNFPLFERLVLMSNLNKLSVPSSVTLLIMETEIKSLVRADEIFPLH